MDNAMTLTTVVSGIGSFVLLLLHSLYALEQPTLDLMVPAALAYFMHRFIANKTIADALTDMAGTAYTHMSAQFASGNPVTFNSARQIAIAAAVTGMDTAVKSTLIKLTPQQIAAGVNSKLGQLLASDTSFAVTDPLGKRAASAAAAAAATARVGVSAIQITDVPAAEVEPAATPPALPTPSFPVNFDITSIVQDAVRQGVEAALHNGLVTR